jgi:uncharacterized protein DUF4245
MCGRLALCAGAIAEPGGYGGRAVATSDNERVTTPTVERARRGDNRSPGGLVGALIVVIGLIVVVGGFTWLLRGPVDDPARTVDYSASLSLARQQAPFHVVFPTPVPQGLRATSVSWDGLGARVSWHVGFITQDQNYTGLFQGNGPVGDFVSESTPATTPGASVTVAGETWRTLTKSGQGETALVRTVDGVTTVVTGTVDEADLANFVARLR